MKYLRCLFGNKSRKRKPTDPVSSQDIDVVIGTIFQLCRNTRNEIGHPQIAPVLIGYMGAYGHALHPPHKENGTAGKTPDVPSPPFQLRLPHSMQKELKCHYSTERVQVDGIRTWC